MLKKLALLLLFVQINSFCMEEAEQDITKSLEPRSISDHYYCPDVWRNIAIYLPGDDLFLNTDIARNIELASEVIAKIIKSFFKSLHKMPKHKLDFAIEHFFKTTHLELSHNPMRAILKQNKELIQCILYGDASRFKDLSEKHQRPELNKFKDLMKDLAILKKEEFSHYSILEKLAMILGATIIGYLLVPGISMLILRVIYLSFIGSITAFTLIFGCYVLIFSYPIGQALGFDYKQLNDDLVLFFDMLVKGCREYGIKSFYDSIEDSEMLFLGLILGIVGFEIYRRYAKNTNLLHAKYAAIANLLSEH